MPKVASFIPLGFVHFEEKSETPLYRQLYESIRDEILAGRLAPGSRLPSTRGMADELDVSRNTAVRAYDQLLAEGYIESKVGTGTCVALDLPEDMLSVNRVPPKSDSDAIGTQQRTTPVVLSERGRAIDKLPYRWEESPPGPFSTTMGDMNEFPAKVWERLLTTSWQKLSNEELGYRSACGYGPLREVLANFLQTSRGVRCTPEQIIITNGAQQALTLTVDLLLNAGDQAWVENPCFNGIRSALGAALCEIVPVPVDQEGLDVEEGERRAPNARLAFISPSHQYPLGVTMSLARRLELLRWAETQDAWIIEDDYDSIYRHSGHPLAALQGLDNAGRVIYVGTFSKVLFPAMRAGYMVVPPDLVEPFHAMRAHVDRGSSVLEQVALASFIDEGHLARHIRRMVTLYRERQAFFIQAANAELNQLLTVEPNDTGLHLVGWLPKGSKDAEVSVQMAKVGVDAAALSSFALEPLNEPGLVLGYAAVPKNQIKEGIRRMHSVLQDYC